MLRSPTDQIQTIERVQDLGIGGGRGRIVKTRPVSLTQNVGRDIIKKFYSVVAVSKKCFRQKL
jgi:hypothetical protein